MFLECCSMDKPWNVVPQESEHRGKLCLITHICVLLLCVIIHGFFFYSMRIYFSACTRGLQDCAISGAAVCELLDRTGRANMQATRGIRI